MNLVRKKLGVIRISERVYIEVQVMAPPAEETNLTSESIAPSDLVDLAEVLRELGEFCQRRVG